MGRFHALEASLLVEIERGVVVAPLLVRRIDIKAYPFEQLAFATLAFTSGKHFNQSIRAYAKLKGWSLSDHGLCPVIEKETKFKKATVGESLRCATEEEIFWALGLEYKHPWERNCYDNTPGYTAKNQR